jgi:TolB-like protein
MDSIAVLPLEIRSNDAEYMSDWITESINNSLARLPNLKVIPDHRAHLPLPWPTQLSPARA